MDTPVRTSRPNLSQAHDRDRALAAFDLHDGVVQAVTGALLRVEAFRTKRGSSLDDPDNDLGSAVDALREALDEARRLMEGLHPPMLDREGLVEAVRYLSERTGQREGLIVEFTHDVRFRRLHPLWESSLFRIVQEALHNAVRHADARQARVRLEQRGEALLLEIRDEGRGFDATLEKDYRFGLRGIRERAAILGGAASIESGIDAGTTIRIVVPMLLAEAAGDEEAVETRRKPS